MKEYYKYKHTILYQGDVLEEDNFSSEIFDLIITSPPYNLGIEYESTEDSLDYQDYLQFSKTWISNCFKWSKQSCRFLLNVPLDKNKGGHRSVYADITRIAQEVGWKYHATIVWNEGNISRRTAWGSWKSASAPYVIAPVEMILILYKSSWKKTEGSKISDIGKTEFMDWTNGLWTFSGESKKKIGHPAPFPKELPRRCIKLFSYVGDLVFDPFCGSGTTLIESMWHKRKSIGLEIDPTYCELIKKRIQSEINLFTK
jgi:site-specific DNA-methyltransferase (adenine-specific)